MIDKLLDRHMRSQFRETAEMIAVPVRDDQMIDLLQAGIFHRRHDAARIARCRNRSEVSGVDQQRLS